MEWLGTVRNPSAADPVTVDIGPGFFGPIFCGEHDGVPNTNAVYGNVTFRGFLGDYEIEVSGPGIERTLLPLTLVEGENAFEIEVPSTAD